MSIGIYKITSVTSKIYIGQSINVEGRIFCYRKIENAKSQRRLYHSLKKHGYNNHTFELIHECDVEELNFWERHYQDLFDVVGANGLNCRLTGTNDKSGSFSIETRRWLSIASTNPTEEVRKKLRDARKLRPSDSEETRIKKIECSAK